MYYNHNMSVEQVNNLYYLCCGNKKNSVLQEQDSKKLIEQSNLLSEEWFFKYLIDWIIILENRIMFYCDDLQSSIPRR
jgi:hypothetical protein